MQSRSVFVHSLFPTGNEFLNMQKKNVGSTQNLTSYTRMKIIKKAAASGK